MEKVKERITHYSLYVTALLKWLAVGALVGGVGGFVGALFHLGVDCATNVRLAHPWILYLLPLGGVVIALLYRLCRLEGKADHGPPHEPGQRRQQQNEYDDGQYGQRFFLLFGQRALHGRYLFFLYYPQDTTIFGKSCERNVKICL